VDFLLHRSPIDLGVGSERDGEMMTDEGHDIGEKTGRIYIEAGSGSGA